MQVLRANKISFETNSRQIFVFVFFARHFSDFRRNHIGSGEEIGISREIDTTVGT